MRGGYVSNISDTIPWASSTPGFWSRAGLLAWVSPQDPPLGTNASLPATLLCLYFPASGSKQSRISTQDPGQTFPSELVYYHTLDFSQEEEFPRSLSVPPTTRFPRKWGAHPCLLTPDLGHPRLRSGKLLWLMQPGCFRFAFAPFSRQPGRFRKKKVGMKSVCLTKWQDTLVVGKLGGEWGKSKAKVGACAPLFLTGAKRVKRL